MSTGYICVYPRIVVSWVCAHQFLLGREGYCSISMTSVEVAVLPIDPVSLSPSAYNT